MRIIKRVTLFAFIVTLFVTCKKEQLPPSTTLNQPIFSFNGSIASYNMTLQAGVNNYYMYSSFSQDSSGVYSFTGALKSTSTNQNSLQITINDYKTSLTNAAANINTSLVPAFYSYGKPGGNTTSYSVKFLPLLGSGTPSSYLWNFGDGTTSDSISPTHVYTHPSNYHTSLAVQFLSALNNVDSNVYKMGTPDASNSITLIQVVNGGGPPTNMKFTAAYNGTSTNFFWDFGDGNQTITAGDTVVHKYTLPGMYRLALRVTDINGNISTFNENIVTTSYSDSSDVNYGTLIAPQANPLSLSNVTITYTDGGGNVYTSNNSLQSSSSWFKIISVTDYQNNQNNDKTKMLNIQFNCLLYPLTVGSPIPASGTAIIAVAYK